MPLKRFPVFWPRSSGSDKRLDANRKELLSVSADFELWLYNKSWGTEGCNNAIKTLKRLAFGFRNFRSFRTRILLSLGPYPNI